jgi:hypothetical protein
LAGVRRDNRQSSRSAQGCAEDAGLRDVQRDIRKPSGRYITKQGRNGRGAGGTVGGTPLLHLYSRHTAKHLVNTDQPRATRSGRSRCFLSRRGVVSAFSGEPSTQDDRHDRAVTRDSVPRPMSDRRHTRYTPIKSLVLLHAWSDANTYGTRQIQLIDIKRGLTLHLRFLRIGLFTSNRSIACSSLPYLYLAEWAQSCHPWWSRRYPQSLVCP